MSKQAEPEAVAEVRQAYREKRAIRMPIGAQPRTRLRRAIHEVMREDIRKAAEGQRITLKALKTAATRVLDKREVAHGSAWFHTVMHGTRIPNADEVAAIATALGVEMSQIDSHLRLAPWSAPNAMLEKAAVPKRKRAKRSDAGVRRGPRASGKGKDGEPPKTAAPAPAAVPVKQATSATEPSAAIPTPPRPAWPNPDAFGIERPRWEKGGLEIVTTDGTPFSQTIVDMAGGDPEILRKMAFSLETTASILRVWAERAEMHRREFGS